MRPAKRGKVAVCRFCNRPADDVCSVCSIILHRRKAVAQRWNLCRLGKFGDHWLNAACDVVGDDGVEDVIAVVGSRLQDMSEEDVDVCARLVALCHRCGHKLAGDRLFALCRRRFQRTKSKMAIIASTFCMPLDDAGPQALATLREAVDRGRFPMASAIVKSYRTSLPATAIELNFKV